MKRISILALVLVLALGGAFWYWTTTPQYAIEEAKSAVKSHDLTKFQKFVDTNSVANGLVDDFMTEPMQRALGVGLLGHIIVGGFVALIRPRVAEGVKQEIFKFVETGSFTGRRDDGGTGSGAGSAAGAGGDSPQPSETSPSPDLPAGEHFGHMSLTSFDRKFGFRKHAFRKFEYVNTDGKAAEVGIVLHNQIYNKDLLLKVQLNQIDSHWEVTHLANFPEFVTNLAKLQMDSITSGAAQ